MNFNNKYITYNQNALVQKELANDLLSLLKINSTSKSSSMFEIGCGTGIFTKLFINSYNPSLIILNDMFDTTTYLTDINYEKFIKGNIENLNIPNVDIIVSSSVFQWINDLEKLLYLISKNTNELAFSLYIKDNLLEIKKHFGISLNYLSFNDIYFLLNKYFPKIYTLNKEYILTFPTPFDSLKHLKNTGVTGFNKTVDIKKIRTFTSTELTYKTACFYAKK